MEKAHFHSNGNVRHNSREMESGPCAKVLPRRKVGSRKYMRLKLGHIGLKVGRKRMKVGNRKHWTNSRKSEKSRKKYEM